MSPKTASAFDIIGQAEGIAAEFSDKGEASRNVLASPLKQVQKEVVEQAKDIFADAQEQINFFGLKKPDEAKIKLEKEHNKMLKIDGYKEARKELDKIMGRATDE